MKRKILLGLLTLVLTICCIGLVACGDKCDNGHKFLGKVCSKCSVCIDDIALDVYEMDYSTGYLVNSGDGHVDIYVVGSSFSNMGSSIKFDIEYGNIIENLYLDDRITFQVNNDYSLYRSLTNINVYDSNPNYKTIDGNLYSKDGTTLIKYVPGKKATVFSLPNSVKSIGDYAFSNCDSLTSIELPDSVTSIGNWAFRNCTSLKKVTIPNSITNVGADAFAMCSKLTYNVKQNVNYLGNDNNQYLVAIGMVNTTETSLIIVDTCNIISDYAFFNCASLKNVSISNSIQSIGKGAFDGCDNLSYNETSNVKYLGGNGNRFLIAMGMKNNNATELNIDMQCKIINYRAFSNCDSLTSITMGNGVTSIGSFAFSGCTSLTDVNLSEKVKYIGDNAFYNCPIENATIPTRAIPYMPKTNINNIILNGGEIIVDDAFSGFTSLLSIQIPISITHIGDRAFYNCESLLRIHYKGTAEMWGKITKDSENLFYGVGNLFSINCLDGILSKN